MPIESATYISQLTVVNPLGTDLRSTSDDHLRLIKTALTNSFVNIRSEVSASASEMNQLVGVTTPVAEKGVANTFSGTQSFAQTVDVLGIIRQTKGADISSTAALAIAADSNYADVDGTDSITSLVTTGRIGTVVKLHFNGALTLTHDATDLILPGGADITTASGDEGEFIEYASADFRCTMYTKAAGVAVVSSMPVGTIIAFAGTSAPAGFLALPVTATDISRATYAALFAAIGTTWGVGDGSTTFGMPFLIEGHVPVQADGNVANATSGTNLSHTHAAGTTFTVAAGGAQNVRVINQTGNVTGASGGTYNLAAGNKMLWIIKV